MELLVEAHKEAHMTAEGIYTEYLVEILEEGEV
jgi:hypothetical protein